MEITADSADALVMEDKRDSPRYRVMKPGFVGFGGSGVSCLVCNVSQSGAAIEIKGNTWIPDSFSLTVDSEQISKDCRVIWRKYQKVGVRFI